jgi:hypothetical protein
LLPTNFQRIILDPFPPFRKDLRGKHAYSFFKKFTYLKGMICSPK